MSSLTYFFDMLKKPYPGNNRDIANYMKQREGRLLKGKFYSL